MPMLPLPPAMLARLAPFAPLFGRRVWPSALVPGPLREGERLALDWPDAPGAQPLGGARLGAPVPHRAGPLGALCPGPGAAPQDPDRLGAPAAPRRAALVAGPGRSSPSPIV